MQLELNEDVFNSRSVRAKGLEYRVGDSRPSPGSVGDRVIEFAWLACSMQPYPIGP